MKVTLGGVCTFVGINLYKGNEQFYKDVVMPMVHVLEPEKAHRLAIWASKYRMVPKSRFEDVDVLVFYIHLIFSVCVLIILFVAN